MKQHTPLSSLLLMMTTALIHADHRTQSLMTTPAQYCQFLAHSCAGQASIIEEFLCALCSQGLLGVMIQTGGGSKEVSLNGFGEDIEWQQGWTALNIGRDNGADTM